VKAPERIYVHPNFEVNPCCEIVTRITGLPGANSIRRQPEDIEYRIVKRCDIKYDGDAIRTDCGGVLAWAATDEDHYSEYDFCPYCGGEIVGGE